MTTSPREETFQSPFAKSVTPDRYGADSWYQHDMVKRFFTTFMQDPFEKNEDLRGRKFEVIVHEDGLHVTIREVVETTEDPDRHRYCDPDRHRCVDLA
jgi:hypothetical protein